MNVLDIIDRKQHTNFIVDTLYNTLKIYLMWCIQSYVVISFVSLYALIIFSSSPKTMLFKISVIIIIMQIISNIYFNGCFLTKLERKFLGKEWFGFPFTFIFKNPTKLKVNSLYAMGIFVIFSSALYKIYMSP